jgi:hypothetical protein
MFASTTFAIPQVWMYAPAFRHDFGLHPECFGHRLTDFALFTLYDNARDLTCWRQFFEYKPTIAVIISTMNKLTPWEILQMTILASDDKTRWNHRRRLSFFSIAIRVDESNLIGSVWNLQLETLAINGS